MTALIAVYTGDGCAAGAMPSATTPGARSATASARAPTTAPGSRRRSTIRARWLSPGSRMPGRTGCTSTAPNSSPTPSTSRSSALGRHALAVEAFGEPASLSSRGRRLRRRSWWHCGGPFGRVGHADPSSPSDPQLAPVREPIDALLEVETWVERLSSEGRRHEARQIIMDALAVHGRHPTLLRCLAELEDSDGAPHTALYLWCEAYRTAPTDVDIVCGLAWQLSMTWLAVSDVTRFHEAVQVLSAFPNQQDPKIRAARGEIFGGYATSSSRVVAAYGIAKGLPAYNARARRRCWWRSAGPLGQFATRLVDWRRGPWPITADRPAPRASAESEEVARLLDSLDGLPASSARERIEEAWQQYGRLPSLLLAHAGLDWTENDDWQCLVLGLEALKADPSNIEAVCYLARSVNYLLDHQSAAKVLENSPSWQCVAVRVALGNLHRDAGNFALAVAAYGDPRDLDRADRRSLRHSERRGLLQRRRTYNRDGRAPFDVTTFNLVDLAAAQVLDKSQSVQDSADHGRVVLEAGIADHGRHPLLLLSLARAERLNGNWGSCEALAAEASTKADGNRFITVMAIQEMWVSDFDAESLKMLNELPDKVQDAPDVRVLAGYMYDSWNLPCHAALAYARGQLDLTERRRWRACWWRSGGPHHWLRRTIRTEERAFMSDWQLPESQRTGLAALSLPTDRLTEVRGDLTNYRRGLLYRTRKAPGVAAAWSNWVLLPAAIVLMAIALTFIEHLRWPANHTWQDVALAVAVMTATCVVVWVIGKLELRTWIILAIAACSAGAAAFLLQLSQQLQFAAGLTLAALALYIITAYLAWTTVRTISGMRDARWRRNHAVTAALSDLLDLLNELAALRRRRDDGGRRKWMTDLEKAAIALERDLPYTLRSGDPKSQADIVAHASGAATTLRTLKRSVALANETSWDRAISQLKTVVTVLAQGDLAALPEAPPTVTVPRQPRPWWWHAMQITRTLLVIFTPPLVAFLLPLVAPLNGPGVAWLRLATLVWALLASIVALDPGIAKKVSQMREILGLWREAGSFREVTGQDSQNVPTEQAPLGRPPGSPVRSSGRRKRR